MTLFKKSSILFIVLNLLRLLSVVSILMAFSGEIVVLVSDVKGYRAAGSISALNSSSSSSATLSANYHSDDTYFYKQSMDGQTVRVNHLRRATPQLRAVPSTHHRRHHREQAIKRKCVDCVGQSYNSDDGSESDDSTTSSASSENTDVSGIEGDLTASEQGCSYVSNTSVPKGTGGIVFVAIQRIVCCVLLLFMLVSELPPPSKWTPIFWAYAFPPFGETFGVGVLGLLQVFLGSIILSHFVTGFPLVAAWFLFLLGFLNLIAGLAWGARINNLRSLTVYSDSLDDDEPIPNASDPRRGFSRTFRVAFAHPPSEVGSASQYSQMTEQRGTSGGSPRKGGRGVQISTPVVVPMPPPIYQNGRGGGEVTQ